MKTLLTITYTALAVTLPTLAQAQRPRTTAAPPPATTAPRIDSSFYNKLQWRSIGPFRGGRVTAVAGVRGQRLVHYFGATGGGVWKTTNGGLTWQPVSDKHFAMGSVGAIEVAESDPNVVYVGMGESPIRGNVSPGDGMYRSTDAGKTWTHIGLREAGQIGAVRVHPDNADLVYVAALGHAFGPNEQRGVFRSKDGGKTWERILYRDQNTGAVDLAMDPVNPRILYAGLWQARRQPWILESGGPGSGLFKSTDGGDTWTELTRMPGLPKGVIGKVGVTVSPANHDRVWAIIEAEDGGVFRSDDAGARWIRTNEDRRLRQRAWYYTHIHADSKSPETVYVLNVQLFRSVDGGRTFSTIQAPHGDHHALWIDPDDPQRVLNGNDGGANVSYNAGATWTAQDMQPTAQFYHVTTTNHVPYRVCGAQQDNSTVCVASRTTGGGIDRTDWYPVGGGESGWIAARPDNPDIVFAGSYGGHLTRYDHRTGQQRNINAWPDNPMGWGAAELKYRFQWTFPIVFSPLDPNDLYIGANVVFRSHNEGQSWDVISPDLTRNDKAKQASSGGPVTKDNTSVEYYNTVFVIAPSPHRKDVLWVGTDDGLVQVTRNGGGAWQNVTPPGMPEWALVSSIDVSPHDSATAYVAATRYELDDFAPYIYKTADFGKTWRKLTAGIPDRDFVRVVREDPKRKGLLYTGTETGVYVSFDDGGNWQPLQLNLPRVPIHDLTIKENDLVAATHGRSFWILDDLTPLHQLTDQVAQAETHLFTPRDVVRMGSGGGGGGGGEGGGGGNVGRNPPFGAVVHYTFRKKPEGEVTLEFLDARDSVIRKFSSKPVPAPGDSVATDTARAEAGMNRFVWNLRYPNARGFRGLIMWSGGLTGPLVAPGTYQVRLSSGTYRETRTFQVKADPRVAATQQDLERQRDVLLQIRDRLTAANEAVIQIREIKEQVDAALKGLNGQPGQAGQKEVVAQADSLKKHLSTVEEEIYQVKNRSNQDPLNYPIKLNNKIAALAGVVASADAAPTAQTLQVFQELSGQLQVQMDRLQVIIDREVPAFNDAVKAQNIPAIKAGRKPIS